MRWPRAWASRRSAKVESPAMRMRSIGSICTAMARGMGDPVGRVSRFPAYTRTARDGEAALTSSASRRMQSRVERERLLKIQAIEACGLERVENQVPTMGRNRARNRHEASYALYVNASRWSVGEAATCGGAGSVCQEAVLWSPSGKATVLQDLGGQG